MAKSVESLLENLTKQSSAQDSKFTQEAKKAEARHEELVKRDIAQEKSDAKRDKFAMQQQGQEVQLTKKTQHSTHKTSELSADILDDQGDLVKKGAPVWDSTAKVMTEKDAGELLDKGDQQIDVAEDIGGEINDSLDVLTTYAELRETEADKIEVRQKLDDEKTFKLLEKGEKEKKKESKKADEAKEDVKKSMWATLKSQKETFDKDRIDQAKMGNMVGAIKTDASLIFGSLGALTSLPGVQSVMTASKFILSNIYLLLVKDLIPWMGKSLKAWGEFGGEGLRAIGNWIRGRETTGKLTAKASEKANELQKKWQQKTWSFRSQERIERRLGFTRQEKDEKGKFTGRHVRRGFGRVGGPLITIFKNLLKPLGFILKILNPFRKIMLVAVLAIGGLYSLFKGSGGTKEGFFSKINEYWQAIKTFFTKTLIPLFTKLKENVLIPLWDIFLADILPFMGWLFEGVKWVFFEILVPIGKLLGKVFALLFKYYGWIYDKIFKPLLNFFGITESDPEKMDARGLKAERNALKRDKENEGLFRRWSPEKQQRLDRIEAKLEGTGSTTGAEISGLNDDLSGSTRLPGLGDVPNKTIQAANSNTYFAGNKSIYSGTSAGNIQGFAFQGSNSVP